MKKEKIVVILIVFTSIFFGCSKTPTYELGIVDGLSDDLSDEVLTEPDDFPDEETEDDGENDIDSLLCRDGEVKNCVDFESFERCVDGLWETISLEHKELEWSCRDIMKWDEAITFCEGLGGRFPNIQEVRMLIKECPQTEYPQPDGQEPWCEVEDPWSLGDSDCSGCAASGIGKYSVFGDPNLLLSSSSLLDTTEHAWFVHFLDGSVSGIHKSFRTSVRCVRDACKIEGDIRVVSCGFNDNGDQKQICTDGTWIDQGVCEDPDECENGGVKNCVDFQSFERCVDGLWETISLEHKDLEWSCMSPDIINWQDAMGYCEDKGWRLPTISELRTLIQNCSVTETGGSCGVTDNCLLWSDCWSEDVCWGCSFNSSGKYSVFKETSVLWSSSSRVDSTDYAWHVNFNYGIIFHLPKTYNIYARCVRSR